MIDPLEERLQTIRDAVARRRAALNFFDNVQEVETPQPRTARRTLRRWKTKGYALLTAEQENEIVERLKKSERERELARAFNVSRGTVAQLRKRFNVQYQGRIPPAVKEQIVAELRASDHAPQIAIARKFNISHKTVGKIHRAMVSA
jgi:DNA-binding CsgD family transcriptional regulator